MTKSAKARRKGTGPARTVGQVMASLPYRNLPLLELDPLPCDVLPELSIPGVDESPPDGGSPQRAKAVRQDVVPNRERDADATD